MVAEIADPGDPAHNVHHWLWRRSPCAAATPVKGAGHITSEPFDTATFALLFDVDGTLIDIAPTPQSVHVSPSLRQNLRQLAVLTNGATALISGRPLSDLDRLFESPGLAMVGGHGAEIRVWHNGSVREQTAPPLADWIRQRCREVAKISDQILIEDKGYSIAIHYRLAPKLRESVRNAAASILADAPAGELELLQGKEVVEIKHAGLNKGGGIRSLMTYAPFAGRRPIFVGDDVTDEDAFAVMPEFDGIAFSVGRSVPGATRRFETPAEVRRWIAQICRGESD
jgi:trehalose 6-phosphate phosphatase